MSAIGNAPPGSGRRFALDSAAGRLPPAERAQRGKAARSAVPRDRHAVYDPPADRADPVSLLERQAATRLPDLVPVRYTRMLASPFSYFRGAALSMAADLAATPVSGLAVQACGDAHLSNFGVYASPERALVFDLNDFDETLPAPWEWDVKRLAASIVLATRQADIGRHDCSDAARTSIESYRKHMREYAEMSALEVWYSHLNAALLIDSADTPKARRRWQKLEAKARR